MIYQISSIDEFFAFFGKKNMNFLNSVIFVSNLSCGLIFMGIFIIWNITLEETQVLHNLNNFKVFKTNSKVLFFIWKIQPKNLKQLKGNHFINLFYSSTKISTTGFIVNELEISLPLSKQYPFG